MKHALLRAGIALALCSAIPTSAHAQFGRLGDAVKKKAKEVGAQAIGKEDPKKEETTSAPKLPQMPITTEVLDNFTKGLTVETSNRGLYVKRQQCAESAIQSAEYMQVMAQQGKEMGKQLKDGMTDAEKNAVIMKSGEEMQKQQLVFIGKKCGPEIARLDGPALEAAGAEAAGLTQVQYAALKERITAYCDAVAHGSDTPSDHNLVFTSDEIAAMKPRCAALGAQLKRVN